MLCLAAHWLLYRSKYTSVYLHWESFWNDFFFHLLCLCAGYRHVYLEGMEEASIFVHVAVHDIAGKVGIAVKATWIANTPSPCPI